MKRIFLTLAIVGNVAGLAAFFVGWLIGDASVASPAIQKTVSGHMLLGLAALVFQSLVHAICLTYFMGTGRWMEETSNAYRLDAEFRSRNQSLKYRSLPGMVACLLVLVATGALGAAADPATPANAGILGLSGATLHFLVASIGLVVNAATNLTEYSAISRNSNIVDEVMVAVRTIRRERGLPVS